MRHSATRSLLERRDVVVVASVSCIYGIGAPETYQGMHLAVREGERRRPRRHHPPADLRAVRAQRLRLPPGDVPRPRRRGRGVPGQRGVDRDPDRALRRHDRRHPPHGSAARARCRSALRRHPHLSGQPLRDAGRAARPRAGDRAGGAGRAAVVPARAQSPAGGPAAGAAHAVRHGDAPRARLLPRHRELLAPPHRSPAGRGAAGADRVPAQGRADHHRREPRGGPAGARDVLRRPLPQGVARRVRLPAALGLRQPAADLRGVHAHHRPDGVRVGHARPPTSWSWPATRWPSR